MYNILNLPAGNSLVSDHSSKMDLLRLLFLAYLKLVFLANLLVWPVAYIVMKWWLQAFASRVGMAPVTFILAGVLTLGKNPAYHRLSRA